MEYTARKYGICFLHLTGCTGDDIAVQRRSKLRRETRREAGASEPDGVVSLTGMTLKHLRAAAA